MELGEAELSVSNPHLECPLCFDLFESPTLILPCCHSSVCGDCVQLCITKGMSCPMCRADLDSSPGLWVRNRQLEALCESVREGKRRYARGFASSQQQQPKKTIAASGGVKSSSTGTDNSTNKCIICLDLCDAKKLGGGLHCCGEDAHLLCSDCFPSYVQSLCHDQSKLLDLGFEIRCPYPQCQSKPFDSSSVTSALLSSTVTSSSGSGSGRGGAGAKAEEEVPGLLTAPHTPLSPASAPAPAAAASTATTAAVEPAPEEAERAYGALATAEAEAEAEGGAGAGAEPGARAGAAGEGEGEREGDIAAVVASNKSVLDQYIQALVAAAARGMRMGGALPLSSLPSSASAAAPPLDPSSSAGGLSRRAGAGGGRAAVDAHGLGLLLEDALNARCPAQYCLAVLDPIPDGCCAMRCSHCGTHFCWLCGATSPCSGSTHNHVRACQENPTPGHVFLSSRDIDAAQKQQRLVALRRALGTACGAGWAADSTLRRVVREHGKTKALLAACNVTVGDLFDAKIVTRQQLMAQQQQQQLLAQGEERGSLSLTRRVLLFLGLERRAAPHHRRGRGGGFAAVLQDQRAWMLVLALSCLAQYAGLDVFGLAGRVAAAAAGLSLSAIRWALGHYYKLFGAMLEWSLRVGCRWSLQAIKYLPQVLRALAELALASAMCVGLSVITALRLSFAVLRALASLLR